MPPFARGLRIQSCKRPTGISINSAGCSTACLRQPLTLSAAFLPAPSLMQSQNVSFLPVFHGFTILSHFSSGVSACARSPVRSERIVFGPFSRIFDTFSLFQRRFCLRRASYRVRTYRFCPFFMGLRYFLTFSAAFLPALSTLHGVESLN